MSRDAWTWACVNDAELTVIAVSSDVLQQLELFSQYSAASYCASNIGSTGDKLTCEAGNCAVVQEAETTTLHEFEAYVLPYPTCTCRK